MSWCFGGGEPGEWRAGLDGFGIVIWLGHEFDERAFRFRMPARRGFAFAIRGLAPDSGGPAINPPAMPLAAWGGRCRRSRR